MNEKQAIDTLEVIKQRFELEGETGDRSEAARRVGVSSTVVYSALRKEIYESLTPKEKRGVNALVDIMNEKKKERNRINKALRQ